MEQEWNIENDNNAEVMLPGFRFHPTDEELVGFYLRRKVQHKPLSIELIKQLDIYKYDPWDLPKMATTGEKEWYFYCPRDRKYRNSARPNRVTAAGFWKATGTDRPIYSSDGGTKCIGLKKSLVFYRGRAARGTKTDWMMHEFRLPSAAPKKYLDKNIPAHEAWAICRIFKKASTSAQRALTLSHQSWISTYSDNTTMNPSSSLSMSFSTDLQPSSFSHLNQQWQSNGIHQNAIFDEASHQEQPPKISTNDASSLLLDMSTSVLGYGAGAAAEMVQENGGSVNVGEGGEEWGMMVRYPSYGFALSSNLVWDSSPCPSELSTAYSTNNCYT
ncbi:hypothetical protein SASPL_142714 [Salvia splendens]|uniref:NAC domain-containing protein n=1 Tax=Salvia splendens TaxID=180675 RepID=A0A8X8WKF0_SALSN|nr:protein FEZ-like [Salvia splendens]KAG6396562.1 hypothetical protein SASPL_142714 [Salvia splendens]